MAALGGDRVKHTTLEGGRLTIFQFTDLHVLLLQPLTDLVHGGVVAERLGHLVHDLSGSITRRPYVVALRGGREGGPCLENSPLLV